MKDKTINNKNSKGQYHGYQEWYNQYEIRLRGNFKNRRLIGYVEVHGTKQTNFYIK